MKLSDLKIKLNSLEELNFTLPNGQSIPKHFHITEVGQVNKDFIDCGGTVRQEKTVSLQLWEAGDYDHRLAPKKLHDIIELSEKILGVQDGEVEIEYQSDTIGKFGLDFKGSDFILTSKKTACLTSNNCGAKEKLNLSELKSETKVCCTPGGGCC